jgi:hypothetical protein
MGDTEPQPLDEAVRNIDRRLTHVEQILPTLATKAELGEAIAALATKAELREAIAEAVAPLATKAELHEAIAVAIAPLATKAELYEEGERTRRHFDVVAERLEGQIHLIAEGQMALHEEVRDLRTELKADIAQLDRRVMRLEVARRD